MGYEKILSGIDGLKRLCSSLSIGIPQRSPFRRNVALVKEFIADLQANAEEAVKKWAQHPFEEWYWAMLSVEKLCSAVSELQNHPGDLKRLIPLAIMEDIKQDFEPSQSKTYLYELEIGARFQEAGFAVTFEEPDVRISSNGLSQQIGLACKYPSSEKKLDQRISEGYDQIDRQGIPGLVAVGMDILCCRGMKRFVQFPDSEAVILGTMADELSQWAAKTTKRRAGVKGRRPLNGAVFTLSMTGIFGEPPRLTPARQMILQIDEDNPLSADVAVIAQAIGPPGA
jgi:hypothetical protein